MSDEPAVCPGSYVKLSTLADGTIRVVIDVEPPFRAAAFAMFTEPGAAVAIARVTKEAAQAAHQPESNVRRRPSAQIAALLCREASFWTFLRTNHVYGRHWTSAVELNDLDRPLDEIAASAVRSICGVSSRADIREGTEAEKRWQTIEATYLDWQRRT